MEVEKERLNDICKFVADTMVEADLTSISMKQIRNMLEEQLGAVAGRDYDKV